MITIITWVITRAKKFSWIEKWKIIWETIIQCMNNFLHLICTQEPAFAIIMEHIFINVCNPLLISPTSIRFTWVAYLYKVTSISKVLINMWFISSCVTLYVKKWNVHGNWHAFLCVHVFVCQMAKTLSKIHIVANLINKLII